MTQLPVLSDGVTGIHVSADGRWILGTTNNYTTSDARVTYTIRGGQALPTGPLKTLNSSYAAALLLLCPRR